MKGYKLFLAWLFTVILGSIGLPILSGIIGGDFDFFSSASILEFFGIVLLCMIISAILSFPTLITLIITNVVLKGKQYDLKVHFKKINKAHLLAALVSLLLVDGIWFYFLLEAYRQIEAMTSEFSGSYNSAQIFIPLFWMLLVFVWYLCCALVCWILVFLKEIKLIRASKIENPTTDLKA